MSLMMGGCCCGGECVADPPCDPAATKGTCCLSLDSYGVGPCSTAYVSRCECDRLCRQGYKEITGVCSCGEAGVYAWVSGVDNPSLCDGCCVLYNVDTGSRVRINSLDKCECYAYFTYPTGVITTSFYRNQICGSQS